MQYADIPKRTRTRCFEAAAKIDQIEQSSEPFYEQAPKVIEALGRDSTVFQLLDEKPSWFFGDKSQGHQALRSVRNSPTWAPRMYASFKR